MKRTAYFFVVILLSLVAASCTHYKYETVDGDPLQTKMYTLDNGLQVYMSVNKAEPRIQTYIAVKVGGKNDPAQTTGLAHYFEHLMFKGTQQFGTSDYAAEKPLLDSIEQLFEQYRMTADEAERAAIYHQIDSISYEASKIAIPNEYDKLMSIIGANGTNAWTSVDETVYTEDIPSNQIENWAKIQSDRFKNVVIRGFHTELETIYEEKNMSLTQDSRKMSEALDKALFPHHPYGKQTVLGTQEHLKNPSITNVKNYHDTYYVPNNIAICLSGDFDPDEMIAVIEKYFGDWVPNPSIPQLQYEPEDEITEPIVMDVYGLESETVYLGWRLPAFSNLNTSVAAIVAEGILSNGQAGLLDIDVTQQQKALVMYGGFSPSADYSEFIVMARPKQGQTMEQLRDIALEEIAKLRNGDFDETLICATANNYKLSFMRSLESNSDRANNYIDAFITGTPWSEYSHLVEKVSAVTKDDIVNFANEYLKDNNYAIVYKRVGEDKTVQKISAPSITPIEANRDKQSDFLVGIQNTKVEPIEPVFVDFEKDMTVADVCDGVQILYTNNTVNDIFQIEYVFNTGLMDNPLLEEATSYIDYLGTPTMSAEQRAAEMYNLACDFEISCGGAFTTVSVSGLSENMGRAIEIVDDLILNASPDEDILAALKADEFKARLDAKAVQRNCYNALRRYVQRGPEYVKAITIDNQKLLAMTSEELLSTVKALYGMGHDILYYGPQSITDVETIIKDKHYIGDNLQILPQKILPMVQTPDNHVYLVQYDAKQVYYLQYSNRGEKYSIEDEPVIYLYNEYFGGGMNTIVFQEMREARGLAYSAWAILDSPSGLDNAYTYTAYIATQNDKVQTAVEAFDEIINEMPESEAALSVAMDAIDSRIRTLRTTGMELLQSYRDCRQLGLSEPLTRKIFEALPSMNMATLREAQQKWVKGRPYDYLILGDIKDLDMDYIKTLGPVTVLSSEQIFGY